MRQVMVLTMQVMIASLMIQNNELINLQTIAIIFDVLQPSLAHALDHEMNDLCHIDVTNKV